MNRHANAIAPGEWIRVKNPSTSQAPVPPRISINGEFYYPFVERDLLMVRCPNFASGTVLHVKPEGGSEVKLVVVE